LLLNAKSGLPLRVRDLDFETLCDILANFQQSHLAWVDSLKGGVLGDIGDFESLERRRHRALFAVRLSIMVLIVALVFRFVPRLNDALSGNPHYARVLTESFARQVAAQSRQFPVIVEENESGRWPEVKGSTVPDDDYRGTLYMITYSEKQHLTCITTYGVLADAAGSSNVYTITPEQGKNYGPALLRPVRAVPIDSVIHVYAAEYLKRLHWRYKPHFPLSASEATSLASRSYYSGAKEPEESASIEFNYEEIRAEVAKAHTRLNFGLSLLLICCVALLLGAVQRLASAYRKSYQYCLLYHLDVTVAAFLKKNFAGNVGTAKRRFFETQQETQKQLREQEKLRLLQAGWEASLRSALPKLNDEQLRMRVQELMETGSPDLERMKVLLLEIQEQAGQKTPAEKLSLLVESIRPYCTEEEFQTCRAEAFAVLAKSGFRPARKLVIAMHDQFKVRAREMEDLEKNCVREAS
jgi:hypothetical protein